MLSRLTIEAVAARATTIALVVLEMSCLSRWTCAMRSYLSSAFDAAHLTTSRHSDCKLDFDRLPRTIRPQLAVGRSRHLSLPPHQRRSG